MTDTDTRDRQYQQFLDWARGASVPVMLEHVATLMRWQVDPHCIYGSLIEESLRQVARTDGWHKVLELIADVQRERERQAA